VNSGRLQPYKLVNLGRQLKTPVLVRVDINLPVSHGQIEEDALKMRVYGHVLEMYSDYAGLVVMSHQGRKGGNDFTSFLHHSETLRKLLPDDMHVDFVPYDKISGDGLIFLGGDTSQELNAGGLLDHIEDSGGRICISGGSFLHGWAGGRFPPIEALLSLQGPLLPHSPA
jgi:3-phosphoglycerate kinase